MRKLTVLTLVLLYVASLAAVSVFAANAARVGNNQAHMVPIESRDLPLLESGSTTAITSGDKPIAIHTALGYFMSPGLVLETTDYDLQHNSRMARQVAAGADGRVHFVWTYRPVAADDGQRSVHYTSYNPTNGILDAPYDLSNDEPARTPGRFCTVDVFQNRGLVADHYGPGPSIASYLDVASGGYSFTPIDAPSGVVNCQGIECRGATTFPNNYIWPVVAADQDGAGHLLIHVAGSEGNTAAGYNAVVYFRGVSPGVTMAPGMYGTCGTFIDSSTATGYDIAADPYSDRVVVVYPLSRTRSRENNDLGYRLSTNLGQDWGPRVNVTNYPTEALERVGEEVSVLFTSDNCFHVLYVADIYDSALGTVSDKEAKLFQWTSCDPTKRSLVVDANTSDPACNTPAFRYNVCKINLTQCISSVLHDTLLYAVYTRYLGTAAVRDCSDKGFSNGEVFVSPSSTWGETWGAPVNLTNTNTNGCLGTAGDDCADDNFSSSARYVNDSLRIEYLQDLDAGSFVGNESGTADRANPMKFLSYPCIAMDPYQVLTSTPSRIKYPFHAVTNAAATQDLLLLNGGNEPINWNATVLGGDAPVALPGSGIVPAGFSNSATITATIGPKSIEGLFHNTIRFTYQGGAKTCDVPVDFYVFDSWFLKEDITIRTATSQMNVNQVGQAADGIPGKSFTYFADGSEDFTADASLIMGNAAQNLSWRFFDNNQGDPTPNNNFGWLYALTHTTVDSITTWPKPSLPTDPWYGWVMAQGSGTNRDTTVGYDVKWYAAHHDDSADFYIGHFEVYKGLKATGDVTGLDIAFACDWDVPSDSSADNTIGYDSSRQMVYLQGQYSADRQNGFAASAAYREDGVAITGGFGWGNDQQTRTYGGFQVDSMWKYLEGISSAHPYNSTWLDSVGDMNVVMVVARNYTVTSTSRLKFDVVMAAKRAQTNPTGLAGLTTTVDKARSFICKYVAVGSPLCASCATCGDADGNGTINISDAVFLIAYIFAHGVAPGECRYPFGKGDADGNGTVNISDAVYLIAYIFAHGNAPHCNGM